MIIKKDSEIVKAKVERKSLALKAKKESSDEECSWSDSGEEDDEKICLGFDLEPDEWIKDRGCSKHMAGKTPKALLKLQGIQRRKVKESLNVTFDETPPPSKTSPLVDDDLDEEEAIKVTEKKNLENDIEDEILEIDEIFEMSMMGKLNFFVGLQIKQMEDGIFFNQSKYIKEILNKLGLEESKPMKTPMSSDTKLMKDEECKLVDSTKYRGMIGSLLYLTTSRPDIMFSVCLCARFQEDPKTSHLEVVKRIFRYIKGTTHLGLWYPKGTNIETVVYADSDHARDYVDRKSTSGICTFVGCCLTSWFSKKQTALAISTAEAEYVSVGKACQQALWMKHALNDYDIRLDEFRSCATTKA
ncbi:retrovirus-related pol polyprotein from transposon TNT 1-94 [Tanacetum coccineum]